MKWKLVDNWYAISDCGRYRVSRCVLASGNWFDAWYGTFAGGDLVHLHGSHDKRAAMQACEDDAAKRPPVFPPPTKGVHDDEAF